MEDRIRDDRIRDDRIRGDRIRVAQVVTRFVAGAGGVALRGAEALDPRRYDVAIVAAPDGGLLVDAERDGFEVIRVPDLVPEIDPGSDARALRQLCTILTEGTFDVVHTHSAKAGALGRLAAHLTHVPAVVHTFHGFPFHEFQSPWRRWTYVEIERRLAAITDRFLAVGSAVAAEAVRRRIAPVDRIRVVDSAISDEVVPRSAAARFRARGLLGVPPGMQVVGAVGRLDEQKAPRDFVAAFARIERDDVLGVWVGDGPLRPVVERDIRDRGLEDRIVLLGHRRDVPDLLPGFDVFALSSLYEGVPCAVVEAMRCGVPVVATAVNGVHEVVVPGRSGLLVPPRDPRALARALGALLEDPAEGARLAAIAQRQLEGHFATRDLGQDLMETYEVALRAHAAARGGGVVPAASNDARREPVTALAGAPA
jgi:glycosyltransferase involved in cell wall biosynthesis